ncbi:hypothetical protein LguiA_013266 [Lonicera macranthoides]
MAKPRMPQKIKTKQKCQHLKWRNIEHNSSPETECGEQSRGPRVPPAQQCLEPLPLRG